MTEHNSTLRDVGEALLVAGNSLGSVIGKFAENLRQDGADVAEQLRGAVENAREAFNAAGNDNDFKAAASSFVADMDGVFSNLGDNVSETGDSVEASEAKDALRLTVMEIRDTFANAAETIDVDGKVDELKERLEALVAKVQDGK